MIGNIFKNKKNLLIFVFLCVVFGHVSLSAKNSKSRDKSSSKSDTFARKLQIISTNDVHQHSEKLNKIKSFISKYRSGKKYPVIWLDAGDVLEVYDKFKGNKPADDNAVFNWLRSCDACVPGNHDYYKGVKYLADMSNKYSIPYVFANLKSYPKKTKKLHRRSSNIINCKGCKIGIVGVMSYQMNHRIPDDKYFKVNPYNCDSVKNQIKYLKKNCDFVVMLTHQGDSADYAAAKMGVDAVIGGHSHTNISTGRKQFSCAVTKAHWQGDHVGITEIVKTYKKPQKSNSNSSNSASNYASSNLNTSCKHHKHYTKSKHRTSSKHHHKHTKSSHLKSTSSSAHSSGTSKPKLIKTVSSSWLVKM